MKIRGLVFLVLCQLACSEDMGQLNVQSLAVNAPAPTTFPAYVTKIVTNTKGAVATLSGSVQALRYSYDGMKTWINLMGPFSTSYNISNVWPLTVSQACVQAQGTDGKWYGDTNVNTQLCVTVVPQWMDLTGLMVYFRFDNSSLLGGQNYTDSIMMNQGALVTGDTLNKSVVDGSFKAIQFDGMNDGFTIPYNAKYDVQQISFSLFIKKTVARFPNWGHIMGRQLGLSVNDSWALGYDIYSSSTNDVFNYGRANPAGTGCDVLGPLNNDYINQWVHIAVTDDTNTINMYINGTLYASKACGGFPIAYDGSPICIGSGGNDAGRLCNTEPTSALMSEVSIWSRILTPTEIANINSHKTLLLQ